MKNRINSTVLTDQLMGPPTFVDTDRLYINDHGIWGIPNYTLLFNLAKTPCLISENASDRRVMDNSKHSLNNYLYHLML